MICTVQLLGFRSASDNSNIKQAYCETNNIANNKLSYFRIATLMKINISIKTI